MFIDIIVIKEDKYRKGNDVKFLVEYINEIMWYWYSFYGWFSY